MPSTLTLTLSLQRNTHLFLFPLLLLSFITLALNAAKSFIHFGRIKRHSKAWWSAEVEEAVSESLASFLSTNLEKEVKIVVERCYGSVSTRFVSTSKCMLPVACMDVLPTTLKSSGIYEYECHCNSRYLGRTFRRLHDRIKQHLPQWLRHQLTVHADLNHTDRANEKTPNRIVTLPLVNIFWEMINVH